jgi:hypothetical protein
VLQLRLGIGASHGTVVSSMMEVIDSWNNRIELMLSHLCYCCAIHFWWNGIMIQSVYPASHLLSLRVVQALSFGPLCLKTTSFFQLGINFPWFFKLFIRWKHNLPQGCIPLEKSGNTLLIQVIFRHESDILSESILMDT